MRIAASLVVGAIAWATPAVAEPLTLAPFKDELFAYPKILDQSDGGDVLLVEYDQKRDLDQRDITRRLKVDPKYVSLETQAVEQDLVIRNGRRRVRHVAVGNTGPGASAIVIFLHGRGADRKAGANDWIHGGNFNRLKNLMMRSGGLYLSPDFADFGRRGASDIKTLLLHYANQSPGAPVVLGCASWGGRVCWRLMNDPEVTSRITGLVFLDSATDRDFLSKLAALPHDSRPAIHISNTRADRLMGYKSQLDFYRRLKAAASDYPIRVVNFSSGTHGISLRMTDWRQVLNWMFASKTG
ncbi:alpha/beta fold hydrolase [Bauldia sp.]|uniref:alpha/beta fold hydrolase n=1 Tax=Bauldia sp. TaxID=2575872 RepID=UPI003BA9ABDE